MSGCLISSGDTTWVLISAVLVLTMCPALALFEGGLVRSKNVLSIFMQVFVGVAVLTLLWFIIGFTLVYGKSVGGVVGNLDHVLLLRTPYDECHPQAPTIPAACFALFQAMFAVITPLLATGAFAERLKFKVFFWFSILYELLVYVPLAHAIWNDDGWLAKMGVQDFAGGIVIHTACGITSLVSALILGRRRDFELYHEYPPHNLPMAALGFALLCAGWAGFNGGSALSAGFLAVSAVVSSYIALAAGSCTWLVLSWWLGGKPTLSAVMNGGIAGLAGITPISGYANSPASLVVGFLCGLVSFFGIKLFRFRLRIDDALDVSSVHGLTGIVGSLAIGFAADSGINPQSANGLFFGGGGHLLGVQLLALLFTLVWSGLWTFLIFKLLDRIYVGIRVKDKKEALGLDYSELDEVAYHDMDVLESSLIREEEERRLVQSEAEAEDDRLKSLRLPLSRSYRRHTGSEAASHGLNVNGTTAAGGTGSRAGGSSSSSSSNSNSNSNRLV